MTTHWQCLIGRHDWHVVQTPDRDKYAECSRCGKHDWSRLTTPQAGPRFRGGAMPPGGDSGGGF
jgi:hypothetical protein